MSAFLEKTAYRHPERVTFIWMFRFSLAIQNQFLFSLCLVVSQFPVGRAGNRVGLNQPLFMLSKSPVSRLLRIDQRLITIFPSKQTHKQRERSQIKHSFIYLLSVKISSLNVLTHSGGTQNVFSVLFGPVMKIFLKYLFEQEFSLSFQNYYPRSLFSFFLL